MPHHNDLHKDLIQAYCDRSQAIFRKGKPSPSNFRLRQGEDALSFRSSLSNCSLRGKPPALPFRDNQGLAADPYSLISESQGSDVHFMCIVIDELPGDVVANWDNEPPGHVTIAKPDPQELSNIAKQRRGRFGQGEIPEWMTVLYSG